MNKVFYPLNDFKHWLVWFILASGVTGVAYLFSKAVSIPISNFMLLALFSSWLISISILDYILHKLKLQ